VAILSLKKLVRMTLIRAKDPKEICEIALAADLAVAALQA
jgi:hypothetical protein